MTDPDLPYTRRAFTDLFLKGRAWLRDEFQSAGLEPFLDAGGNLRGRRDGASTLPALMSGSHSDTVPSGGRFDGIVGVVCALEVAHVLEESNTHLRHPYEAVDFLSEEASDYGASCIGSRALAGPLSRDMLAAQNAAGESLAQAIRRVGGHPDQLQGPLASPRDIAAFVEIHIEQGPVLQARGIPIGIVSGIVGIRRYQISVLGRADHAGTTPMGTRRDALVGAAMVITKAHERARDLSERLPFVATIGRLNVTPNAQNVVPSGVHMVLEARCTDVAALDRYFEELFKDFDASFSQTHLRCERTFVSDAPPALADKRVMSALWGSCEQLGYKALELPSGAGHDAMQVAALAPFGMIFVPSRQGRSHTPEEFTDTKDIVAGARVLLHTMLELDTRLDA